MFNLPDVEDFNYMLKELGTSVLINDVQQTAIITNLDIPSNDTRNLATLSPIQTGDWVKYNDSDWLVMTDGEKRYNKYCVLIQKSSYRIAFPGETTGTYIWLPVIIQQRKNARDDQGYFVFPDDEIIVTVSESDESSQIATDDEFVKWGVGWKVESRDRATKGLINLYCVRRLLNTGETEPVEGGVSIGSVGVSPSSVNVTLPETYQLIATVYDTENNELTNELVSWTSSNTAVATVDSTGLVTSVAEGSCTITAASVSDPEVTGTCAMTIAASSSGVIGSVVISRSTLTLTPGESFQLTATVKAPDETVLSNEEVSWSSSNTSYATVDSTGKVTGVALGNSTVTATSVTDTSKSGSCAVTVEDFW